MQWQPGLTSSAGSLPSTPQELRTDSVRTDLQWEQVAMEISDERSKKTQNLPEQQYMSFPTDTNASKTAFFSRNHAHPKCHSHS